MNKNIFIYSIIACIAFLLCSCKRFLPPEGAYEIYIYANDSYQNAYKSCGIYILRDDTKKYVLASTISNQTSGPYDTLWVKGDDITGKLFHSLGDGCLYSFDDMILKNGKTYKAKKGKSFEIKAQITHTNYANCCGWSYTEYYIQIKKM